MRLYYVATPFGHPEPVVREMRYQQALSIVTLLSQKGRFAYSPIVHYYQVCAKQGWDKMSTAERWAIMKKFDFAAIDRCDEALFFMLEGWETSVGMHDEQEYCKEINKPFRMMALEELEFVEETLPE